MLNVIYVIAMVLCCLLIDRENRLPYIISLLPIGVLGIIYDKKINRWIHSKINKKKGTNG